MIFRLKDVPEAVQRLILFDLYTYLESLLNQLSKWMLRFVVAIHEAGGLARRQGMSAGKPSSARHRLFCEEVAAGIAQPVRAKLEQKLTAQRHSLFRQQLSVLSDDASGLDKILNGGKTEPAVVLRLCREPSTTGSEAGWMDFDCDSPA